MNALLTVAFAAALLLAGTGCTPKNFNEPGIEDYEELPAYETFNVDSKLAWEATFQVMSRYPIVYYNQKKMEIQTDWIKCKSERLFSEYDENRVPYAIRFRLYVHLEELSGSKTKITVTNKEQYRTDILTSGGDFQESLYEWIETESTTYKENSILKKVELELGKMIGAATTRKR